MNARLARLTLKVIAGPVALTGSAAALAQTSGWAVDTCYTKVELAQEAGKAGIESSSGLEPEISPGVDLQTKDDDTESPFYDQTLEWKMRRFAQMMVPGGFDAMVDQHAKDAGETPEEALQAVIVERSALWLDIRTAGVQLKIAVLLHDTATGKSAKLLSDLVADSGEPSKFCVIAVQ